MEEWRSEVIADMWWWSAIALLVAETAQDAIFLRNCSFDEVAWAYIRKKLQSD